MVTVFDFEKAAVNFLRNVVSSNYQCIFEENSMTSISDDNLLEYLSGLPLGACACTDGTATSEQAGSVRYRSANLLKAYSGIAELRDRNPDALIAG